MILAGTGHRRFPGFEHRTLAIHARRQLKQEKPDKVISGMAIGWDMILASAAIDLGIPLIVAIPFKGQEQKWPREWQEEYWYVLKQAERVKLVCDGEYEPWKFQRRNEWMVDKCQMLLAAWSGQCKGGTYNCIKYAMKEDVKIKFVPELLVGSLESANKQ